MIARHTKIIVTGLLAAFLFSSAPWASEPADPAKNYMGINVNYLADYSGENAFVDIMKHARDWMDYNWVSRPAVDSENWPMQDCSNVIFGVDNALGVYKLIFEGKASSVGMMWTAGSVSNLQYHAATNTSTADVTLTNNNTGGLKFQGTQRTAASATNSGIRNVRLCRPGYPTDGSVVFTNEWLAIMRKFHAIRFITWLNTSNTPMVSWNQRMNPFKAQPPTGIDTINGKIGPIGGAAMEYLIQACNAANADLWMNIPPMANDDYVTKTAQLILYGSDGRIPYTSPQASPVYPPLNPNLKVYVEYGNEIWNFGGGFMCGNWIQTIVDSILADLNSTHPIVYDGFRSNEYYSIARWSAWRTVGISNAFRGVFGDGAMMTRVRPVLMGQLGGNWFNPVELPFLEGYYATYRAAGDAHPNTDPKPVSYYMYGAGGSGYYGANDWSSASPDAFFTSGNCPNSTFAPALAGDAIWARNYGLKRIAYEAGMSLDGNGNSLTEAQKVTLNADPRMKDVTVQCHDIWTQSDGDLIMYFEDIHAGHSDWAFTNSVNNPNSPKLQAIDKLRDTLDRTPDSLGAFAPCTLAAQTAPSALYYPSRGTFYDDTENNEGVVNGMKNPGYWIAFPVTAHQAGWYRLSARCGSTGGTSTAGLYLNGTIVATRTAVNPLGNTPYVTIQLTKGLNVIRYQSSTGASCLQSVMVTPSDTVVGVAPRLAVGLNVSTLTVKSASGSAIAHVSGSYDKDAAFAVYDAAGKRIARGAIDVHSKVLVLPRLVRGAYFLRIGGKNPMAGHGATAMIIR